MVLAQLSDSVEHQIIEITMEILVIWVIEFSRGNTKLSRLLASQSTSQRKLLNSKNYVNGELLKIGHHFSNKGIKKQA